jgi:hypothetical protein
LLRRGAKADAMPSSENEEKKNRYRRYFMHLPKEAFIGGQ